MSKLRYAERLNKSKILGPYNRAILWVYGCCFECEGCIAKNFRYGTYQDTTADECAEWYMSLCDVEGITISGGEPILQAEALADMLDIIEKKIDLGVILYTGFLYDELLVMAENDKDIERLLGHIDLLIDGPYMMELDDNQPYKGSANQRFILLTERYKNVFDEYYSNEKGRKIEFILSKSKSLMVGVPSKEQTAIWNSIKELGE